MPSEDTVHDVVIVGGRVAGALTAAFAAQRGMTVLVLEARHFPSPTLSTHFFRGDGLVRALADIGALGDVLETGAPPLTCEYFYLGGSPEHTVNLPQEPGDSGYCLSVRRQPLDHAVATHVEALPGVDVQFGAEVVELLQSEDVVTGVRDASGARHLAKVVVGADGRRSKVAEWVGAADQERHLAARVMYYRYLEGWRGPDGGVPDGPEFSLLGNEMVYVFPSDAGTACVALSIPLADYPAARENAANFFSDHVQRHRGLWPRYALCTPLGRLYAGPPHDSFVRQSSGPGWALVGDAGTHQDPWSGVGMDTAARQARALAELLTADPADWNQGYGEARNAVTLERFTSTITAAPDLTVLLS